MYLATESHRDTHASVTAASRDQTVCREGQAGTVHWPDNMAEVGLCGASKWNIERPSPQPCDHSGKEGLGLKATPSPSQQVLVHDWA